VRGIELDALRLEVAALKLRLDDGERRVEAAGSSSVALPGGIEITTLRAAYAGKLEALQLCARKVEAEHEAFQAEAAIDFLGLSALEAQRLIDAYFAMDPAFLPLRRRLKAEGKPEPPPPRVTLDQLYDYIDYERSPLSDAVFYVMDPEFKGHLTIPSFLRSVTSFCMFGSADILKFVFCVVSQNTMAVAERNQPGGPPEKGKAGRRGVNRANNAAVYWPDAVPWEEGTNKDNQDRITVKAFAQVREGEGGSGCPRARAWLSDVSHSFWSGYFF
jgi:hypothetical protein